MRSKLLTILIGMVVLLSVAGVVLAGSLDPPVGPTGAASQMVTLEQIYTRLTGGGNATKMAAFSEPSTGPGSTMHTLDDIYALAWPARVPETGQTTSYATGDDGDLEKGVSWPNPRFTDNSNGTVTDNLTGLIWLKNANCFDPRDWATALTDANTLASGSCGLTDDSVAGAWRLPNLREILSLVDYGQSNPALPSGHPFTGVQFDAYATSTTYAEVPQFVWYVNLRNGYGTIYDPAFTLYVWPVRGGQ